MCVGDKLNIAPLTLCFVYNCVFWCKQLLISTRNYVWYFKSEKMYLSSSSRKKKILFSKCFTRLCAAVKHTTNCFITRSFCSCFNSYIWHILKKLFSLLTFFYLYMLLLYYYYLYIIFLCYFSLLCLLFHYIYEVHMEILILVREFAYKGVSASW